MQVNLTTQQCPLMNSRLHNNATQQLTATDTCNLQCGPARLARTPCSGFYLARQKSTASRVRPLFKNIMLQAGRLRVRFPISIEFFN
jgi:hypothetical protein